MALCLLSGIESARARGLLGRNRWASLSCVTGEESRRGCPPRTTRQPRSSLSTTYHVRRYLSWASQRQTVLLVSACPSCHSVQQCDSLPGPADSRTRQSVKMGDDDLRTSLPIPTYDEAIASRPSSSSNAFLGPTQVSQDAERQGLLRQSPYARGWRPPTVESARSSMDFLGQDDDSRGSV